MKLVTTDERQEPGLLVGGRHGPIMHSHDGARRPGGPLKPESGADALGLERRLETQPRLSLAPRFDNHVPQHARRVSLLQIRVDQTALSVICPTLLPPHPGHLGFLSRHPKSTSDVRLPRALRRDSLRGSTRLDADRMDQRRLGHRELGYPALLPRALARYMALSAAITSECTSSPSSGYIATPMLAPTVTAFPPVSISWPRVSRN